MADKDMNDLQLGDVPVTPNSDHISTDKLQAAQLRQRLAHNTYKGGDHGAEIANAPSSITFGTDPNRIVYITFQCVHV